MGRNPDAQLSAVPGREAAERFFEPQLRALELGVDQIDAQSLQQLQDSLKRVNEAIANAAGYDTISVKMTADTGAVIAKVRSDAHFTFSIVPFLLERKRLILTRIRELGGEAAIEALDRIAQANGTSSDDLRSAIAEVRDKLEVTLSAEREEVRLERETVRAQHRVELTRARAEIWHSFLARESVASIVGGILLVALAGTIVVAMFADVEVTEVLANAFLLILGYFFGQSVGRERNANRSEQ